MVRVVASGPGDLGSVPGRVIPKTQKMVFDATLLNTQHYKERIKGKEGQSRKGVVPSPTPWCSSYRKRSLQVTLDDGRQLYFTYITTLLAVSNKPWKHGPKKKKKAVVRLLTSHLTNCPSNTSKIGWALLVKQRRTRMRRTLKGSFTPMWVDKKKFTLISSGVV